MKRLAVVFALLPLVVWAGVDDDWASIVAMDSGPAKKPATRDEARALAARHFAEHTARIQAFIAAYPDDPRVFDAHLRLAAILAASGQMEGKQGPVDEAIRLLADLEKTPGVPLDKRADAGFRRVSLYWQSLRGRETEMRSSLIDAARNFVARYPGDRRGPRLLVEVATICDYDPTLKRTLLEQARDLSREDALNHRIADDLVRLNLLDKSLALTFPTLQGGTFDLASQKGNVVLLVFWSAESPHALMWLPGFLRSLDAVPKKNLRIATVALDTNRREVTKRLRELQIEDWPTAFDGRGWESPLARDLGINAVPTVFAFDKTGKLRALNARENADLWVRRLLRE